MPYILHDTVHRGKRSIQRDFSLEQARLVIAEPGSILKTPPRRGNHGGMIWLFFRAFESRTLVIVAEVKGSDCWLITGYWHD